MNQNERWSVELGEMRSRQSYWLNNDIVREAMYRNIADENVHFLPFTHRFFGNRTFESAISLCCGDGAHEAEILQQNIANKISAVDWSTGNIESFYERCSRAGISRSRANGIVASVEEIVLPPATHDIVFSIAALHHVLHLENVVHEVAKCLVENGILVLLEYVGPTRFQVPKRAVALANRVLETAPTAYLNHAAKSFVSPSVTDMLAMDRTEAQRPRDIMPLLLDYFEIIYERDYFGNVIHHLYPYLNHELANVNNDGFDTFVRMLLLLEKEFVRANSLESDFKFAILKKKPR